MTKIAIIVICIVVLLVGIAIGWLLVGNSATTSLVGSLSSNDKQMTDKELFLEGLKRYPTSADLESAEPITRTLVENGEIQGNKYYVVEGEDICIDDQCNTKAQAGNYIHYVSYDLEPEDIGVIPIFNRWTNQCGCYFAYGENPNPDDPGNPIFWISCESTTCQSDCGPNNTYWCRCPNCE